MKEGVQNGYQIDISTTYKGGDHRGTNCKFDLRKKLFQCIKGGVKQIVIPLISLVFFQYIGKFFYECFRKIMRPLMNTILQFIFISLFCNT